MSIKYGSILWLQIYTFVSYLKRSNYGDFSPIYINPFPPSVPMWDRLAKILVLI